MPAETTIVREIGTIPVPKSVLVVIAHPDDIEALCGGTVALLVNAGAKVTYVVLTSGDKGSPDPLIDPRQLAALREAEQIAAATILGIDDLVFVRCFDGEVTDDLPTRAAIAAQIRRVRPELVITFDPWHSYTFHNDHRQAGLVALAAARVTARQVGPAHGPDGELLTARAAPHMVKALWFFLTAHPNLVFDIAPTIEQKIVARVAHTSQAADPEGVARGVRERARLAGQDYDLSAAELFHAVQLPPDEHLLSRLAVGEW